MKSSKLQKIIEQCVLEASQMSLNIGGHTPPKRKMMDDFLEVLEYVKHEFQSEQKHQSWKLVSARDLKLVWAKFAKYSRVDESLLNKIWDTLRTTVIKILINSDIKDGNLAETFFEKDSYDEITEEEWERWFTFVSDKSGSQRVRNSGEVGSGGNARYSDRGNTLYKLADAAESENEPEKKIIKIDQLLNFIHGLGSMAHWFVEGGEDTLNAIRDYQAKGIHNLGTIGESFLDSFESNIRGKTDYVEVFINPTDREIKECTAHDQYGLILSGRNAYVWNRMGAYHSQVRKFLGNKVGTDYVSILTYVVRGREVEVMVSDDTKHSSWHHNPKIGEFITTHPFFKNKQIVNVIYYDENIVGDWKELVGEQIDSENFVFHVTPRKNLSSIKTHGIQPGALAPADVSDKKAVYLFKNKIDVEDAIMNWLGDKFDEDEPLVLLTIRKSGLNLVSSSAGYEIMSYEPIPIGNIVKVEKI